MLRLVLPVVLTGLLPVAAAAQTAGPVPEAVAAAKEGVATRTTDPAGNVVETTPYSPEALRDGPTGRQKFGGIDFGIGVAFTYDLGNNERIKEAEIVDNVVRVRQTENVRARLMLESHYLFTPRSFLGVRNFFGLRNYDGYRCGDWAEKTDQRIDCDARRKNWGVGPFVAVQPGSDQIIDAVGAGLMLGFRRRSDQPDASASFNIGVGVLYDIDVQMLGDGFVENQAPPGTEKEVRFRRGSQSGLLIMTSYSF